MTMVGNRVSLANSKDEDLWKDSSTNETRKRLEYYRQHEWVPPNYRPNSWRGLSVIELYWRKYCNHLNEDYIDFLLRGEIAIYKAFFDWMQREVREERARFKDLETYKNYWKRLSQYYYLFKKEPLNGHVFTQMQRWFSHEFRVERRGEVPNRAKEKRTTDVVVFSVLVRHHWVYSMHFTHGNMHVQFAVLKMWLAISGGRPGSILPPYDNPEAIVPRNRKFKSDLPRYTSLDDLPKSVLWRDIELFVLANPGGRSIPCAIIEFRNLKGRPEGEEGTKFFLHCDYKLAYCPIIQIVSLAFRDNAFENDRLTPEIFWKMRVTRKESITLKWKSEVLDQPVLRRMTQDETNNKIDQNLPMTYSVGSAANTALCQDAGFPDMTFYADRRWVGNEANKNFTEAERKRILGQRGSAVFEKYYLDHNVKRNMQFFVLLRPHLPEVLERAMSAMRHRDTKAPGSRPSYRILESVRKDPYLLKLRQQRNKVKNNIRALAGTLPGGRELCPDLYWEHDKLKKELAKRRNNLAREKHKQARENFFHDIHVEEIDKEIDRILAEDGNTDSHCDGDNTGLEPPVPEYSFAERARLVDSFYGPESDSFDGEELIRRQIQVTKDLITLCTLSEPSRKGRRSDWAGSVLDESPSQGKETPTSFECPLDACILCYGDSMARIGRPSRKFKRIDAIRRHMKVVHFSRAENGIECTWDSCKGEMFPNESSYMYHAANKHIYDLDKRSQRTVRLRREKLKLQTGGSKDVSLSR